MNLYDFKVKKMNGEYEDLSIYKGKVVLIVNTATGCAFTPQYGEMQDLYNRFKDAGFVILDFPCDQFKHQAPGTNEEIHTFCTSRYGITFPQYAKIEVNGSNADPLYKWITQNTIFRGFNKSKIANNLLKQIAKDDVKYQINGLIKWNFTKILIDQNGNIVDRFESPISMDLIAIRVSALLKKNQEEKNVENKVDTVRSTARQFFFSSFTKDTAIIMGFMFVPILIVLFYTSWLALGQFEVNWLSFSTLKLFLRLIPEALVLEFGIYLGILYHRAQIFTLSRALQKATSGDLNYRLSWRGRSSMGQAYADYNQLCQQIKLSQENMQEAVDEANRANKAKSSFLSNMSHEIRTPINAVLGLDEMILRESREKEIRAYATDIKSAGNSLLSLINDILDFSKIESGKMEIIPVEYDLTALINDLVNMTIGKAEAKNLKLTVLINEQMPHLLIGDEIRIRQVALNVLSNAVKYTREGEVKLSVDYQMMDEQRMNLIIHVIDTGIGIKPEDIQKLFKPFERIEEKRNRAIEGTGLGMSITKQFLEMMGSKLEVSSIYGEGSDFSFVIEQKIQSMEPIGSFEEAYRKLKESEKKYTESFHAPNAKIMVVDDVEMNLTVFVNLLKKTQIQIDALTTGKDCLEQADQNKYDLIFIDHLMPDMDGIETLSHLRKESKLNSDTPVIVLTANAITGARKEYIEAGFDDYLTKPIDPSKLEATILKYINPDLVSLDVEEIVEQDLEESETDKVIHKLEQIEGIDVKSGIEACGSRETYLQVIKDFTATAANQCQTIVNYYEAMDFKNYTIQVHALKSSARLVGAKMLSEQAFYLEQMGNEENQKEILEHTPTLIDVYKAIYRKLQDMFSTKEDAPLISKEDLLDALTAIYEAILAFDFDTADQIIAQLDEYRMPDFFKESFTSLKALVVEVRQEETLQLIDTWKEKISNQVL